MNAAAEQLVQAGDALTVSRGVLRALDAAAERALAAAIAAAAARQGDFGGAVLLPSPALSQPLRAIVTPLSVGSITRVLVIVDDPSRRDAGLPQKLIGLFMLTAAEAATVAALAEGRSPAEISEMRQVSLPTVRTQIQSALGKMNARGIADLVRLSATLP
jgi:DNA-binding CsgD family transcriptional regulator